MGKLVKIILFAVLILLIGSAVFTDLSQGKALLGHLDLGLYLKLVSLLGLLIALFVSMGYQRRMSASQKYRRASAVLAEAEAQAEQQKQAFERMEQNLKNQYAEKEKGLDRQIKEAHLGYENRLQSLNKKNIELKETVTKLMRALKRERGQR